MARRARALTDGVFLQMTATAENPDGYGHGSGSVANAVHSFMRWKHPELHYQGWRVDEADRVPGDMRGRALIVSKSGACAQVGQFGSLQCTQWQCQNGQGCADDPDNNPLQIRSENQIPLSGYSKGPHRHGAPPPVEHMPEPR